MSGKLENIFDEEPCLSAEELQAYASGELRGAALHRAERHLLTCPLCSDALEGYERSATTSTIAAVAAELNEKIDGRVTATPSVAPSYWRRMAAAAALLLLAGGGFWYVSRLDRNEKLYSEYYEPYRSADTVIPAPAPPSKDEAVAAVPAQPDAKEKNISGPAPGGSLHASRKNEQPAEQVAVHDLASVETRKEDKKASAMADSVKSEDVSVVQNDESQSRDGVINFKETERTSKSYNAKPAVAEPSAAPSSAEYAVTVSKDARKIKADASQLQRAPLQEAIRNYEAQRYDDAFKETESFLEKNPRDAEALFYNGVSAMNIGKEKDAAKRLEECIDTGNLQWKEEASWYIALCYIKLNKAGKAKPHLQFLAGGRSVHAAEAKKMLESLK